MSHPESPRHEITPAAAEFELDPNGVGYVVQAAVGKLVEANRAGYLPTKPDGVTFDTTQAAKNIRLEAQARTMASTLDLIAKRSDKRTWEEVIEGYAVESAEAAAIDVSE